VAVLARTVSNIRVVIVGGPDHEADATFDIRAAAARHGIADKLTLVGTQPRASLPLWYGAADVFCLPTQREGSANVILEALACGVPCVSTPVGCNAEMLSNPEVGILTPADVESMSQALAHALSKKWDSKAIAQHSQKRPWAVVASECHHHLTRIVTPAVRTVG